MENWKRPVISPSSQQSLNLQKEEGRGVFVRPLWLYNMAKIRLAVNPEFLESLHRMSRVLMLLTLRNKYITVKFHTFCSDTVINVDILIMHTTYKDANANLSLIKFGRRLEKYTRSLTYTTDVQQQKLSSKLSTVDYFKPL